MMQKILQAKGKTGNNYQIFNKQTLFEEENKLWKKGYRYIFGLDEAGRGPLAGPVVAAVVVIKNLNFKFIKLKDSKKISVKKREMAYRLITKSLFIDWAIGVVSEKEIDRINILQATKLAMKKAIKKIKITPDFLIIDGNFKLDLPLKQKSIIKADEQVFSCTAAGIIAKVSRDKILKKYAKKFPEYFFEKHKGYPTKLHLKMIEKHGPCSIHRKSFNLTKNQN